MFQRFWRDEDGGEILEYGLVIGLLVLGLLAVTPAINARVAELFSAISTLLNS